MVYIVVYSKKYKHSMIISFTENDRKLLLYNAAHEAPEKGEGLDPSEEDEDAL